MPVPVIAAIHGIAFCRGFQLVLGADLRYVTPGTRLGIIEAKWGLVPDMAGTQLMRHLARDDVVRELTYTARIFSAEEALAWGFATRLEANPRIAALATAREIASLSPHAIRAAKRLLNQATACGAEDGLAAETMEQAGVARQPQSSRGGPVQPRKARAELEQPMNPNPALRCCPASRAGSFFPMVL